MIEVNNKILFQAIINQITNHNYSDSLTSIDKLIHIVDDHLRFKIEFIKSSINKINLIKIF